MAFFDFIRRALSAKKAEAPGGGGRPESPGFAERRRARDKRNRERDEQIAEDLAAWILSGRGGPREGDDPCTLFLNFGHWLKNGTDFTSSHVQAIQYSSDNGEFTIEYHSGKGLSQFYMYLNITADEARSMCAAISKGTWVWDHLRRRGTQFGHQKPYQFLSGVSSSLPGWFRGRGTTARLYRIVHGRTSKSGVVPDTKRHTPRPKRPKPFQSFRLKKKR